MRNIICAIFCLLCFLGYGQKTKVYLLGTYHMAGTTDAFKVDVGKDNILSAKRQQELQKLLDILEKSYVEQIYVENEPVRQTYWDSVYAEYYKGNQVLVKNEIFQIGMKLAKRLDIHRGVLCVDWHQQDVVNEAERYYSEYCSKMTALCDSLQLGDADEFTAYDRMVMEEFDAFNKSVPDKDLLEVFTTLNSPDHLRKMLYANITTFLDKNIEGTGAYYAQYQMMRNYNIYSNIIRNILEERPARALVLYGAGHIEALKSLFEAHPAIEVVMFDDLLKQE